MATSNAPTQVRPSDSAAGTRQVVQLLEHRRASDPARTVNSSWA